MNDPHYSRAFVLHLQHRYEHALEELQLYLANEPDAADGHYLAAWCLWRLKRFQEAAKRVGDAISADPEWAPPHCLLARILKECNRLAAAQRVIEEALRLDPDDPSQYVVQAIIQVRQGKYADAVATAELGLEIDPTHDDCRSIRAIALSLLGRNEEALATSKEVLADDPEGPFTHASRGWVLLRANEPQRAREHLLEALRLWPDYGWARAGLVQAMTRRRWIVQAVVLAERGIGSIPQILRVPLLSIVGIPAALAILAFCIVMPRIAMMTVGVTVWLLWTWHAISLLLLRVDRFGRSILSRQELRIANFCGVMSIIGWVLVAVGLWHPSIWFTFIGAGFLATIRPLTDLIRCEPGLPRRFMVGYLAILLCLAVATVASNFLGPRTGRWPEYTMMAFLIGMVALPSILKELVATEMPR